MEKDVEDAVRTAERRVADQRVVDAAHYLGLFHKTLLSQGLTREEVLYLVARMNESVWAFLRPSGPPDAGNKR